MKFAAFGQAMNLAKEIVKFPQDCLRADRDSALHAAYSARSLEDAMSFESENSARVLTTEAIAGAKKFTAGLGKHGKFNVNQVAEKQVRNSSNIPPLNSHYNVGLAERVRGNEEESS